MHGKVCVSVKKAKDAVHSSSLDENESKLLPGLRVSPGSVWEKSIWEQFLSQALFDVPRLYEIAVEERASLCWI